MPIDRLEWPLKTYMRSARDCYRAVQQIRGHTYPDDVYSIYNQDRVTQCILWLIDFTVCTAMQWRIYIFWAVKQKLFWAHQICNELQLCNIQQDRQVTDVLQGQLSQNGGDWVNSNSDQKTVFKKSTNHYILYIYIYIYRKCLVKVLPDLAVTLCLCCISERLILFLSPLLFKTCNNWSGRS